MTVDHQRRLVAHALAAGCGAALSGAAWSQGQGTLNLAVLSQFSGNFASFGPSVLRGAQLAIDERSGMVQGRRINLLQRDDEGKPAVGARWLTELIESHKVSFFLGNASSAVGLTEADIAAREKVLQFAAGGSDEFTGGRCNPFTFQWSAHPYTACHATLEYVRKAHPKARRLYLLVADYAFGHSLQKYTEIAGKEFGFDIAAVDRHPAGERQFTQFFNKAVAARPDAILLLTAGADFLAAMRQLASLGLKDTVVAAPWAAEIDDLRELTPEMRDGLILGLNYHAAIESPLNKAFVTQAVRKYRLTPTYPMALGYDACRTLFMAMDKAGSTDADRVARALEGLRFDSVHGPTQIDARTHQSLRPYYVARCRPAAQSQASGEIADLVARGARPQPEALNACKR